MSGSSQSLGSDAYVHIPKDEHGKLDSKASKCVLIDYCLETKGYRLYDLSRQKVVHSHDVEFNEEEKIEDLFKLVELN